MKAILIRHGATLANIEGRVPRRDELDLPLEVFEIQRFAAAPKRLWASVCWSSPKLRCVQTAEWRTWGYPTVMLDLDEMDLSGFTGASIEAFLRSSAYSRWRSGVEVEGLESIASIHARVESVARSISFLRTDVVVVSHQAVLCALWARLTGEDVYRAMGRHWAHGEPVEVTL